MRDMCKSEMRTHAMWWIYVPRWVDRLSRGVVICRASALCVWCVFVPQGINKQTSTITISSHQAAQRARNKLTLALARRHIYYIYIRRSLLMRDPDGVRARRIRARSPSSSSLWAVVVVAFRHKEYRASGSLFARTCPTCCAWIGDTAREWDPRARIHRFPESVCVCICLWCHVFDDIELKFKSRFQRKTRAILCARARRMMSREAACDFAPITICSSHNNLCLCNTQKPQNARAFDSLWLWHDACEWFDEININISSWCAQCPHICAQRMDLYANWVNILVFPRAHAEHMWCGCCAPMMLSGSVKWFHFAAELN